MANFTVRIYLLVQEFFLSLSVFVSVTLKHQSNPIKSSSANHELAEIESNWVLHISSILILSCISLESLSIPNNSRVGYEVGVHLIIPFFPIELSRRFIFCCVCLIWVLPWQIVGSDSRWHTTGAMERFNSWVYFRLYYLCLLVCFHCFVFLWHGFHWRIPIWIETCNIEQPFKYVVDRDELYTK